MRRLFQFGLFGLWLVLTQALAQEAQLGTIEQLDQDNGFVTVSGKRLGFSDQTTQVFLEDRQIGAQKLDIGMVVRYTLDENNVLLHVEIIGPNAMLMELQQN